MNAQVHMQMFKHYFIEGYNFHFIFPFEFAIIFIPERICKYNAWLVVYANMHMTNRLYLFPSLLVMNKKQTLQYREYFKILRMFISMLG